MSHRDDVIIKKVLSEIKIAFEMMGCRKQTSVLSGRIVTAYVPLRSATERERAAFLIPCQGLRGLDTIFFTNSQFI